MRHAQSGEVRNRDQHGVIAVESAAPKDLLYRHLHCVLDLSFVRDLVAGCYASGGRPSIGAAENIRAYMPLPD